MGLVLSRVCFSLVFVLLFVLFWLLGFWLALETLGNDIRVIYWLIRCFVCSSPFDWNFSSQDGHFCCLEGCIIIIFLGNFWSRFFFGFRLLILLMLDYVICHCFLLLTALLTVAGYFDSEAIVIGVKDVKFEGYLLYIYLEAGKWHQ